MITNSLGFGFGFGFGFVFIFNFAFILIVFGTDILLSPNFRLHPFFMFCLNEHPFPDIFLMLLKP